MKKLISIVTPCLNEEGNVELLYDKVKEIMSNYKQYDYEHIFIDNSSTDRTVPILKEIAKKDKRLKIIVNTRNFGAIRSPIHAILQANGEVIINISADFQDPPPELIPEFIKKWEEGYKIVLGVKKNSQENALMFLIRKFYYNLVNKISNIDLIKNATGFGLYDREIVNILRKIDDPYPYLRGILCEIGFNIAKIYYVQQKRKKGITKNNFYILYDYAMLGIVSSSKVPLRFATFFGFGFSILNLIVAFVYLVYKLLFWKSFSLGIAPIVIGLFFFFSVNLFFLGIVGEYILAIYTQVLKRPLVIEKERINF